MWTALLEQGRDKGLVPVGLGARDTLRLEARMCLYGNDIDETTTLVEAGLGWIVSLDERKGDFSGRAVLEAQKASGPPRKLVGFTTLERSFPRAGYPVFHEGRPAGLVRSGTMSPSLGIPIGTCYLPRAAAGEGTPIELEIRGKRVPGKVVKLAP